MSDTIYDVVIIGSGLGGLQCGAILSRHGYKVCVLEKNSKFGGTLQGFNNHGCRFGTGMHYIGSLDKGQVIDKIFRYLGIREKLHMQRMDPKGFDVFGIGGKEYSYPIGMEAFREQLHSYFPNETVAISKYLQEMEQTTGEVDLYNLRPLKNIMPGNSRSLNTGVFKLLRSLTPNQELQNVLGALNFEYAGEKDKTPFYTHALINKHFIDSAWKFVDGSEQLTNLLVGKIREAGGTIIQKEKVTEILHKDNLLTGVKTAGGQMYRAKHIISNIHPALTVGMLDKSLLRPSYRKRMLHLESTISAFSLHLSLKENSFRYRNHNYHFYERPDVWYTSYYSEENWPEFFYLFVPKVSTSDEYAACVSIHTYMKFEEVARWQDLPLKRRGEEYETWKAAKAEKLLDLVTQQFPELKGSVTGINISTPLTFRDYIGTPDGGIYGTLKNYHHPLESYVGTKTKIPNLFFTGQNVNLHGALGVSMSSLLTCGEFIGLNKLIREVNEA